MKLAVIAGDGIGPEVIGEALKHVSKARLSPCTNCGMAPMARDIAEAKLAALGAGAALARSRFG